MAALDCRNLHILDLVDASLTIYLQPGLCTKVAEGVSEVLDSSLFRYLDDHEAVLLGYRNVQILSKKALLTPYLPYLTIEAQAQVVFLKAVPGNVLVGLVHKLSDGMLGLVALGGINATIDAKEMPEGFSFDAKHNCWAPHGDYSRAMMIGDIVACKVLSTPETDPSEKELVFSLKASLLHPHAGLCAQQPQLQDQKRQHLAAMAAAAGLQTDPTARIATAAEPGSEGKKREKQRHRKHKQHKNDKECSSHSKSKKRKREDEDDQQVASKKKKQPEGLNGLSTAAPAVVPRPAIPAGGSSRMDMSGRLKDGSNKHHSSHKKDKHKSSKHKKDKRQHKHKDKATEKQ